MTDFPLQETFDESKAALLNAWFPDKGVAKTRPSVQKIEVEKPVPGRPRWRVTASCKMLGQDRLVQVQVEHAGEIPYAVAEALEARLWDLEVQDAQRNGFEM